VRSRPRGKDLGGYGGKTRIGNKGGAGVGDGNNFLCGEPRWLYQKKRLGAREGEVSLEHAKRGGKSAGRWKGPTPDRASVSRLTAEGGRGNVRLIRKKEEKVEENLSAQISHENRRSEKKT